MKGELDCERTQSWNHLGSFNTPDTISRDLMQLAWVFQFLKLPVSVWKCLFKEKKACRKTVAVEYSVLRTVVSIVERGRALGHQEGRAPLMELSQWVVPLQAWSQLSRRFHHRPLRVNTEC